MIQRIYRIAVVGCGSAFIYQGDWGAGLAVIAIGAVVSLVLPPSKEIGPR